VESIEVWESSMTDELQVSAQRRSGAAGVRWVLIGLCAALILFTHDMSARLGFAALLVLAVIVGRYRGRWYGRAPSVRGHGEPGVQPRRPPSPIETPTPRREASRR
jgi:hypothetical protein